MMMTLILLLLLVFDLRFVLLILLWLRLYYVGCVGNSLVALVFR